MSPMMEKEREIVVGTRGLTKNYGGLMALNGVDLKIPSGPVGLLGPNGAGKSTLIKCILGLVKPTSGTSTVLGYDTDILRKRLDARAKIGYVPENECLIPSMDAVGFVRYMGELSGLPSMEAMQRAHEVLHYVGIGDERYRKIETYSAGMQQKVKLAQALVHDPQMIILDEPTNGMDPKGRQEMLDLIRDISRNHGKNILLSSHLLPDVEYICDHVVIMNFGTILVQDEIDKLMGARDQYEIRIRGNQKEFEKILQNMNLPFTRKGSFFHVKTDIEIIPDLYRGIGTRDIQIRHATRHRQSLEDIFVHNIEGGTR